MASTFTTNLGIEKPATGDQAGVWGETTNRNFDMFDQAINGVVSVTLPSAGTSGSPNNLPITDGEVSDGRNKFIEFVDAGDLSATAFVQLTPNNAEKIVHIRNSLSGSRSIIVFQGTYNSNNDFEIPNGKDVVVKFSGAGTGSTVTDVFKDLKATAVDGRNISVDGDKLDGIEAGATDDQTDAEIKTAYESNANTNAFTDAEQSKLDGIEAGAQVNVATSTDLTYTTAASTGSVNSSTGTNATVPAATTGAAGLLTSADKTKLDGIAAGAQVNVATDLSWTAGTTAGPTVNSSTGTNAVIPTASDSASGVITTGDQIFSGVKTLTNPIINEFVEVVSANTVAVRSRMYVVTTAGLTITLPTSPASGNWVRVSVLNFVNTVVARNGQNIMGLAENLTIDVPNVTVTLIFTDATRGWRII